MDRIVTRSSELDSYLVSMGKKMLRLRGRGGTGKTVMLLQLAWRAFDERAARSVVLTYNHALTLDIRRLLALMNIPSDPAEGGVAVRTVMSFVTIWLSRLGLREDVGDWLATGYESQCAVALQMIQEGAITQADIEALKLADPEAFDFDYIIADEAQDWPTAELELIKALYSPERICLADGVDQLIRGGASNWEQGVPEQLRTTIPLKRCLRMKANLALFANKLSERAGLNWRVEPNKEAGGGRVILITGPLERHPSIIARTLDDARAAGNAAIDLLVCVPPSGVIQNSSGERSSRVAERLNSWGYEVWDGTDDNQRRDFPRSTDSLRVVQYASCRGLEGWTVLLDGLDQHWAKIESEALNKVQSAGALVSEAETPAAVAWRQCIIPLTRAIDTLVICIENPASAASKVLLDVASTLPDIVEVLGGVHTECAQV